MSSPARAPQITLASLRLQDGDIHLRAASDAEQALLANALRQVVSPRGLAYVDASDEWRVSAGYDYAIAPLFTNYRQLHDVAAQDRLRQARRAANREIRQARKPIRRIGLTLLLLLALALLWQAWPGMRDSSRDYPSMLNDAGSPGATVPRRPVLVVRVVDGDTIDVDAAGTQVRVRYLGMDTPEVDEPGYATATQRNRQLVDHRVVYLEADVTEIDRYDRLLRYVFLEDGSLVNEVLVAEGLARVALWETDRRYAARLEQAEADARQAARGLWDSHGTWTPSN